MAFSQGRPNILGGFASFNEGMLRWSTLHKNEGLNRRVVDLPKAVSAGFEMRVRSSKRAVEIEVETR